MPGRSRVELSWGASLYSGEAFVRTGSGADDEDDRFVPSFLGKDQAWPQLATSAMTALVASLDLIQLTRELLVASNYSWGLPNYASYLNALEASHWYAFSFNENGHLRLQLQQRGFMNKNRSEQNLSPELPHLLEQEVLSMEQMLFTVFRLYCHNKQSQQQSSLSYTAQQAEDFAEPLIERYEIFAYFLFCKILFLIGHTFSIF